MDQLSSIWITQTVQGWLASGSGVFLAEGRSWLHSLAIIMLVIFALRWALDALSGTSSAGVIGSAGAFIMRLLIATFLLSHYNTPLPWVGVSFSGLLPDTAATLAAQVDESARANVINSFHQIEASTLPSLPWHAVEFLSYCELLGATLCMQGLLFLLANSGFIAVGIGVAVGPLSIPFFVVPRLQFLFWDWISFMIASSMFQVVGSVLGALWSNVLLVTLNHFFHGNYDIIDAATLVPPFISLVFCMLFTCLGIGAITAALYGRAAASFDGWGRSLTATVKGVL
jgi:hypothetical protein